MMCDSTERFFGIGLKPLPTKYSAKKLGLTLIVLTLVHVILLLNCLEFLEPYYIVIVNVIFASVGILIHSLLIIGAHANLNLILHIWIFLTIFCLVYLVYFAWYFGSLILNPQINGDTFNTIICYIIILETIFEVVLHVYGIFIANKASKEISREEEKEANAQIKVLSNSRNRHSTPIEYTQYSVDL